MSTLLILITEFFKTGLFAVGGGLATIPFLEEIGTKYGYYGADLLSTILAISESTPGPMGINMATYVGYTQLGILGGVITTLSLVAPSIIVIILIAKVLQKFQESILVKSIFAGIKPAVVGFILSACISIFTGALLINNPTFSFYSLNFKAIGLLIALFVGTHFYKEKHPIQIIAICAVMGVILQL